MSKNYVAIYAIRDSVEFFLVPFSRISYTPLVDVVRDIDLFLLAIFSCKKVTKRSKHIDIN